MAKTNKKTKPNAGKQSLKALDSEIRGLRQKLKTLESRRIRLVRPSKKKAVTPGLGKAKKKRERPPVLPSKDSFAYEVLRYLSQQKEPVSLPDIVVFFDPKEPAEYRKIQGAVTSALKSLKNQKWAGATAKGLWFTKSSVGTKALPKVSGGQLSAIDQDDKILAYLKSMRELAQLPINVQDLFHVYGDANPGISMSLESLGQALGRLSRRRILAKNQAGEWDFRKK